MSLLDEMVQPIATPAGRRKARDAFRYIEAFQVPGEVFYVSSLSGRAGNSGKTRDSALDTFVNAAAKCQADRGDLILGLPGHAETLTAAGTLTLSKSGVYVAGLGSGALRPTINYTTAAAASLNITGANVTLENLLLTPIGVDAVTAAVNISAAGVTLRNVEIELANATNQAALGILTTAAANYLRIEDCYLHGTIDAGCATAIRLVGGNDIKILRNHIHGAFTTSLGGIENNTTAMLRLLIEGNVIVNGTASSTKAIVLHANTTGAIVNNRLGILSGTAPITAAAIDVVGGNYYKAAVGVTAGTLL